MSNDNVINHELRHVHDATTLVSLATCHVAVPSGHRTDVHADGWRFSRSMSPSGNVHTISPAPSEIGADKTRTPQDGR